MNEPTNKQTAEPNKHKWTNAWTNEPIKNEPTKEQMNRWRNEGTNGQMAEPIKSKWTNGWTIMNEQLNQLITNELMKIEMNR